MQAFKWCFIGCGKLAHGVAAELQDSGRHKVVSVYGRRFEAAEAFAGEFGATAYATPEEAILAPEVDGIYVVTPHTSHAEYAKLALELGKPVLVEKPFAVNDEDAEALVELAAEKGVYLAEAMWTWFAPAAHQVKAWVDAGEFGVAPRVEASFRFFAHGGSGRLLDPERAGGALLDVGVYPLTYCYRLFGYPTRVECRGRVEGGVDLAETIELGFAGGATARVRSSIADFPGGESLHVEGPGASLSAPLFHHANRVTLRRKQGRNETFRGPGGRFHGYLPEFDAVAADVRAGRTQSELVPLSATLDVMRLMDECRRQMGLVYPFEGRGR